MPCANVLIHSSAYYRKHVYSEGFRNCGFTVIEDHNHRPKADDVLLIWNRSKNREAIAKRYEAVGAKIFVTENGYIGNTKALAIGHHSGAGEWHVGDEDRWTPLGIELKPWRLDGRDILVVPQRSIGEEGVAMPRGWEDRMVKRLGELTDRPVRVRKHPGKDRTAKPIEDDFDNVWAVVTWASGGAIKAIIAGVPVFYQFDKWIGADAATSVFDIESPWRGNRLPMLKRLAWAQWTWDEIRSGEAIRWQL
jgi:hypothetical protein